LWEKKKNKKPPEQVTRDMADQRCVNSYEFASVCMPPAPNVTLKGSRVRF
jgi:hypothetical protein